MTNSEERIGNDGVLNQWHFSLLWHSIYLSAKKDFFSFDSWVNESFSLSWLRRDHGSGRYGLGSTKQRAWARITSWPSPSKGCIQIPTSATETWYSKSSTVCPDRNNGWTPSVQAHKPTERYFRFKTYNELIFIGQYRHYIRSFYLLCVSSRKTLPTPEFMGGKHR